MLFTGFVPFFNTSRFAMLVLYFKRNQYLSLLLFLMVTPSVAQKQSHVRPNIVFILADDLGYKDLGVYGNLFNETPYLDSLARSGLKFNQAYSACPVCSPSRAAIMTGKYPARLHLTNYIAGDRKDTASPVLPALWTKFLPSSEITLAEYLKAKGYVTGIVGKWHLGTVTKADITEAHSQGFDYDRVIDKNGLDYYNYSITEKGKTVFQDHGKEYITDKLTDYALEFIDQNKSKPFFLYLPYSAPHVLIVPKADKLGKYLFKYEKLKGKSLYNPHYAALLESLDEGVERVTTKLKKEGLLENTIIIFTSDNGGLGLNELGPTPTSLLPLRAWKGHVYEGGIRVPLIVSWKGRIPEQTQTENYIIGTDYLPTIAEILKEDTSLPPLDGKSFARLLSHPEQQFDRGPVFWHYPHFSNQLGRPAAAVRQGDYKLVESYETGALELFDLKNDISEASNLADSLPEKKKELHQLLKKWRSEVNANLPVPNPIYKKFK